MSQERQSMKSAGAIVYIIKDNKILYLLLKHVKTGVHWGFPKGRVEEGESKKSTALRELREETGLMELTFIDGFEGEEKYSFERKRDGVMVDKTVTYFLMKAVFKEVEMSLEHSEYMWVTLREALEKLDQEIQKKFLKEAEHRIRLFEEFT